MSNALTFGENFASLPCPHGEVLHHSTPSIDILNYCVVTQGRHFGRHRAADTQVAYQTEANYAIEDPGPSLTRRPSRDSFSVSTASLELTQRVVVFLSLASLASLAILALVTSNHHCGTKNMSTTNLLFQNPKRWQFFAEKGSQGARHAPTTRLPNFCHHSSHMRLPRFSVRGLEP